MDIPKVAVLNPSHHNQALGLVNSTKSRCRHAKFTREKLRPQIENYGVVHFIDAKYDLYQSRLKIKRCFQSQV